MSLLLLHLQCSYNAVEYFCFRQQITNARWNAAVGSYADNLGNIFVFAEEERKETTALKMVILMPKTCASMLKYVALQCLLVLPTVH